MLRGAARRQPSALLTIIALAGAAACSSTPGTQPTPPENCNSSSTTTTIVISGGATCPQNITVPRGSQVTMINQDSVAHEMYSDPHPDHTDCPELNSIGHLEPGQSHQSGNLVTARTCGYHDHLRPDVAALKGSITIQ